MRDEHVFEWGVLGQVERLDLTDEVVVVVDRVSRAHAFGEVGSFGTRGRGDDDGETEDGACDLGCY